MAESGIHTVCVCPAIVFNTMKIREGLWALLHNYGNASFSLS